MSIFQNNLFGAAVSSAASPDVSPGGLWAWGYNGFGQLGLGNTTNYSSPVQVESSEDWKYIFSGGQPKKGASFAIKTDGSLWAWGYNKFGMLGLGDATNTHSSPTQVGSLTDWKSVSIGRYNSFFTKTDGTLWAVGENNDGILGIGDTTDRSSPVQIGSLTTWRNTFASGYCGFGIKTDGTLWVWGNYKSLGGTGSLTGTSSPIQVGSDTNWANMECQLQSLTAVKTDGTLFTWGSGEQGRSDHGNTTTYSSPVQVGSDTDWNTSTTQYVGQAAGEKQGHALKTDGTVWGWGENERGELGNGTTTAHGTGLSSPVQFGAESNWVKIHSVYRTTMAINSSGELWGCGSNRFGELGQGNTTNRCSPVQVGTETDWSAARAGSENILALRTA